MRFRVSLLATSIVIAAAQLALGTATLGAQDTTSTANLKRTAEGGLVQLVLRDGSTLYGRVVDVTPVSLQFSSAIGVTTVSRSAISSLRPVEASSLHDGEIWPEDPSRTRLFFAPTGRMLRQDERYFADPYIFFPSLQYGVTDNVTLGGGMSAFPGLGLDDQLYYITPKVGVYTSPGVNVAVGALIAGEKEFSDASPVGIGYGVATFGDENASMTTGAGFGFAHGNTSSTALVMVGGSRRVSKSIALVSENYFLTEAKSSILYSGGLRFISERLAVDVALVGTSASNSYLFPYLSFIYRW